VIDQVLAEARARIRRFSPLEAESSACLIVDTRATDERHRDGIVPGSVHVPLSVLEWRADQTSEYANSRLAGRTLILLCAHGYSSSLAAARLIDLGVDAGDLDGGFAAWHAAGLPVVPAPPATGVPGMGGPQW
jgi:rhodanese-related sulfurtransferase